MSTQKNNKELALKGSDRTAMVDITPDSNDLGKREYSISKDESELRRILEENIYWQEDDE